MNIARIIRNAWVKLEGKPGGKWIYSKILGHIVPYSGSVSPRIEILGDGKAHVSILDRKSVRNHLNSIHAVALVNIGEMATGLALHSILPETHRAILVKIETQYFKKARGRLVSKASVEPPEWIDGQEVPVESQIIDSAGQMVAKTIATWKIGVTPKK